MGVKENNFCESAYTELRVGYKLLSEGTITKFTL